MFPIQLDFFIKMVITLLEHLKFRFGNNSWLINNAELAVLFLQQALIEDSWNLRGWLFI